MMRKTLVGLIALGALSLVDVAPAAAYDYPICKRTIYGDDDCSYTSLQQCRASASGLGELCADNPAMAYAQQYGGQPEPRRRRVRRAY